MLQTHTSYTKTTNKQVKKGVSGMLRLSALIVRWNVGANGEITDFCATPAAPVTLTVKSK
jgi:hypothetical protein